LRHPPSPGKRIINPAAAKLSLVGIKQQALGVNCAKADIRPEHEQRVT